ncbi:TRAP-type C4-dicarboxylate transport system, small permease component [Poseidonocella pacifica]|uniref:TRAP transporter small permease protein n=1 Tax=Poseidonocella pacifica TaxID=871651 RepID=A0A1I0VCN2_9RHOB|nr:TRAP transporter small permease [Poseidonocella pacifica]SFA73807.1 TRAP-type C4-dicarboxylate transport system, small permease component [Poseidonocella pacifica]
MLAPNLELRVGRWIDFLAQAMAWGGGCILAAISLMTVVSIVGRGLDGLGLGPVTGDYELAAIGTAIAVFGFMPWCQLRRGHVTVDIFTGRLPSRIHAGFGFLGDVLITVSSAVILRQLWFGFAEKYPHGSDAFRGALGMGYKPFFAETTYELQIPVWIPYLAALCGSALFLMVSLYTCWRSLNWVIAGEEKAA